MFQLAWKASHRLPLNFGVGSLMAASRRFSLVVEERKSENGIAWNRQRSWLVERLEYQD